VRRVSAPLLVAALLIAITPACTSDDPRNPVVENAWGRPTGEGANASAYLTIRNPDSVAVHVDSVTSAQARVTELHDTSLPNGLATMTPLTGVDVAAKSSLTMEPGGVHVMLIELNRPMNRGDSVPIRVWFAGGAVVDALVRVRAP
jgi:copper(I)-binding protein